MDLLPITDMAQSAQIAQYGTLANDKLKEASGILQTALDTHMLLSNFDAYKQFSNDVSDQINELTKSVGTQDSEGSFSLSDLYNEAQGKLTKVKGYYNQAKQFQSDVQTGIKNTKTKYENFRQQASEEYNNAKTKINNGIEEGKTFVKDTAQEAKAEAQNVYEQGKTAVKTTMAEGEQALQQGKTAVKTTMAEGEQALNDAQKGLKTGIKTVNKQADAFMNEGKTAINTTMEDLQPAEKPTSFFSRLFPKEAKAPKVSDPMENISFSDPAETATSSLLTPEADAVVSMKTPVATSYYGTLYDEFPDDIFAEPSNIKIGTYKATKKLKKVSKKQKQQQQQEEEVKQETTAPEIAETKPLSSEGADALMPMRELMAQQQADEINGMTTDELASEMINMNGARSPMAEQRYQALKSKYEEKLASEQPQKPQVESTLETPTTSPTSESLVENSVNDGIPKINLEIPEVPNISPAVQDLNQTFNNGINEARNLFSIGQQNLSDAPTTISNMLKSKTSDVLGDVSKSLLGDTEDSLAGDEDPIGLAVTIGLGIASIGTQIADLFKSPPKQAIAVQGQQIGV
jgi:hypothetical protein